LKFCKRWKSFTEVNPFPFTFKTPLHLQIKGCYVDEYIIRSPITIKKNAGLDILRTAEMGCC